MGDGHLDVSVHVCILQVARTCTDRGLYYIGGLCGVGGGNRVSYQGHASGDRHTIAFIH